MNFKKIALVTLYFVLLAGISGKLFFEKQFDALFAPLFSRFYRAQTGDLLTIGYSEPFVSLSPLGNDTGSRARLLHIYEGLVRVTPDLQIEPGLAISYGSLSDSTWEFRIRPGVTFHNGKPMAFEDIKFSIEQAAKNPASSVKDLVSTIKEIKAVDENIFQIKTFEPDPILLSKLASVFIFPANSALPAAPGTGPYMLESAAGSELTIKKFDNYWSAMPAFKKAVLKTFKSKQEKLEAFAMRTVDIVADVPPDSAIDFAFEDFNLKTRQSLEVNFLMFDFNGNFGDKRLRQAVSLALDTKNLARLAYGFAVPATQFVGNGIFGYDPSISPRQIDIQSAQQLVKDFSNFSRVNVTLDLPKGLDVFGAGVEKQLKAIGIDAKLQFLSSAELGERILARKSEFYFFGWRTELGDSYDFLSAVAHSRGRGFGQFNGGNYKNEETDRLIESTQKTLKQAVRLDALRAAMKKITLDDIIGIPLFSPEVLYGVSTGVKWEPRVDGYILAQEVKL